MSALLTSETGNTAKVVKYISECREMNIRVLAPDVNSSEFTFTPVPHWSRAWNPVRTRRDQERRLERRRFHRQGREPKAAKFGSLFDFCEARRSGRSEPPHD